MKDKLTKEQIDELKDFICKTYILDGQDVEKDLTAKFGQQPGAKEESWPLEGDEFFILNHVGGVKRCTRRIVVRQPESGTFLDTEEIEQLKSIGNLYRTKEEAEAVCALRRHVQKFPMPTKKEHSYYLFRNLPAFDSGLWNDELFEKASYAAGLIMPFQCTEEDRAERIELLKKCYA